jgi:hypothetical protein
LVCCAPGIFDNGGGGGMPFAMQLSSQASEERQAVRSESIMASGKVRSETLLRLKFERTATTVARR